MRLTRLCEHIFIVFAICFDGRIDFSFNLLSAEGLLVYCGLFIQFYFQRICELLNFNDTSIRKHTEKTLCFRLCEIINAPLQSCQNRNMNGTVSSFLSTLRHLCKIGDRIRIHICKYVLQT